MKKTGYGISYRQNFRTVQFLASFISIYFEILPYLAFGEKIIKLASENSVKLGPIFSLSDMFQETLFLLKRCSCMVENFDYKHFNRHYLFFVLII